MIAEYRTNNDWKAPELNRHVSFETAASNIFTFGLYLANLFRRGHGRSEEYTRFSPVRPAAVTKAQWSLIRKMRARNPSKRVDIAYVVNRLKHFAPASQRTASLKHDRFDCSGAMRVSISHTISFVLTFDS